MANPQHGQNQQNNKGVASSIKKTAGSAFETAHNALETSEEIAMNTVDAAKNVTKKLTGNNKNNQQYQ